MKPDTAEPELVGIAVEAAQPSGAVVGRVDDASEGARALLGNRVLAGALDACGQCEVCRRGGATVCPLATRREGVPRRVRVASRWVVTLGSGLELPLPAAAAVAGDVATAYTLYARTGLSPREPVVLVGTSPATRFLVEILRAKGITPTVIRDHADRAWADWLLARGAAVVEAGSQALVSSVTAAIAAQGQGTRPWRIIATTPAAFAHACTLAGPRATITALADPSLPALPAMPGDLLAREVTVIGVAGPHPDLVVEAAALCVRGDIDLAGGVITSDAADPSDPTRARVVAVA